MKHARAAKPAPRNAARKADWRVVGKIAQELFNRLGHVHGLTKTARALLPTLAWLDAGAKLDAVLAKEKKRFTSYQIGLLSRCDALLRRRPLTAEGLRRAPFGSEPQGRRQSSRGCATSRNTGQTNVAGRLLELLHLADELARIGGDKVKLIPCQGPRGFELLACVKGSVNVQLHPPAWVDSLRVTTRPRRTPAPVAGRWAAMICHRQFQRFTTRLPGLASRDEEYVHELRVALRRLRSAIKVFSKVLPPGLSARREELRHWAQSLSLLRDDDSFIAFLQGYVKRHAASAAPAALLRHAVSQRARHLAEARRFFFSAAFIRQHHHLCEIINQAGNSHGSRKLVSLAVGQLNKRLAKVFKASVDIEELSEAQLHRLRIQCKRLRYACEFLEPADARKLGALADAATAMQDQIGEHRDMALFLAKLRAFQAAGMGENAELDQLAQYVGRQQRRQFGRIIKAWRELHRHRSKKSRVHFRVARYWDLRQTSVI